MRFLRGLVLALGVALLCAAPAGAQNKPKVLVLTKTTGTPHASQNAGFTALQEIGDAGVQALYRIGFAEETWGQTMLDLRAAADHKLYTADLFHHLNHAANYLRKQKKDPRLGVPPPLPAA